MLWDTHLHTYFSGDSQTPPKDMIDAAINSGLLGICLTDHLDLDYPNDPEYFLFDLDEYFKNYWTLQKTYQHTCPVRIGLEMGLMPHLVQRYKTIVTEYPFDFVIGSIHVVHGIDPYYKEYYEGRTEQEAYHEYFSCVLENLIAFDDFDIIGHIDYVVRYGPNKNKFYSYEKFKDVIDEILKIAIQKGKGIELNTGGFKYGLSHPNPTEEIIKRYRDLGGEIITIGSDAHVPEHVAYDFQKVPAILKEAGFSYYTIYKNRTPEFIRIP